MPRTHRDRLRSDAGFTLIEMLMGMTAALAVVFASYAAMSIAANGQLRTTNRIEAAERGRSAMETLTRAVRAQVCLPTKNAYSSAPQPSVVWATGDAFMFYSAVAPPANRGAAAPGTSAPPQLRKLEWIQTGGSLNAGDTQAQPVGRIVETVWSPRETVPPYTFPSYPNSPSKITTIASDVEKTRQSDGTILPLFRYYGYTISRTASGAEVGRPSSTPYPLVSSGADAYNTAGVPSVDPLNESKIVLVAIQFSARPYQQAVTAGQTGTPGRTSPVVPFSNQVSIRTADPSDPKVSPLCL